MENCVRFVGGGALSPVTARILANILQRPVETVSDPQNVGAVGAAMMVARGLDALPDLSGLRDLIPVSRDRRFEVYKQLYRSNRALFRTLNRVGQR